MYDELVKRLREKAEAFDYDGWVETASDYEQAADAIEELNKEILALRKDYKVESTRHWDVTCDPEYRESHFEKSEWND